MILTVTAAEDSVHRCAFLSPVYTCRVIISAPSDQSHSQLCSNTSCSGIIWRHAYSLALLHRRAGPPNRPAYTYSEVLLHPAAAALKAVVNDKITVEMALGGEQGFSVFGYPQAYMDMIDESKALIPNAGSVKAGVSFNYDKVCARHHTCALTHATRPTCGMLLWWATWGTRLLAVACQLGTVQAGVVPKQGMWGWRLPPQCYQK